MGLWPAMITPEDKRRQDFQPGSDSGASNLPRRRRREAPLGSMSRVIKNPNRFLLVKPGQLPSLVDSEFARIPSREAPIRPTSSNPRRAR